MHRYDLDLTQSAFHKVRGDLAMYGTWHGEQLRPCLALLPAHRRGTPLVVQVEDAWRWNPDDPDASPRMNAQLVRQFLSANGMDYSNVFTAMRVVSFIHDHLSDLMQIPPKPMGDVSVVADAFRTDRETGSVTHSEIIQRV